MDESLAINCIVLCLEIICAWDLDQSLHDE